MTGLDRTMETSRAGNFFKVTINKQNTNSEVEKNDSTIHTTYHFKF